MKFILTSIGTRGDMEPFLAIGEMLRDKGHQVICLFPEQFRDLSQDSGLEFASLGNEFIEMLDSPAGKIAMGGGSFGFKKMKAYLKLISMQKSVNKKMILKQEEIINKEKPDRIIHNGKVMYPVVWAIQNKGIRILVSPVPYLNYVKDHAHVAFNKNYGAFINKLTYKLANFGLIQTISGSLKWLTTPQKISTKEIQDALFTGKVIYTISPSLLKRPEYWSENLQVLGYHERKKTTHWNPCEELKHFLERHQKVILVTFGSMINSDPSGKSNVILEVLNRNNIPAIINTASGGLIKPKNYKNQNIHFVNKIPYDWLFPKLYAVVHHGGSGTTHTAIKYGCPSLIIPHIIDQYVWNKIVSEKKLGPLGIDVSKLKESNLEPLILDLYSNSIYKENAIKIGQQILEEKLDEELYNRIVEE